MPDLSVPFAGLRLRNPLIASAGPITARVEMVGRLADSGIGAIVTKTGFTRKEYEKWVGRRDIFPYKPVYKYQALQNGKLLCLPTLADVPVAAMAGRIERMKRFGVPIIGSIMGLGVRGYQESARILESAGADAIELDLCCTIPEFTFRYKYAGQNATLSPRRYARLVKAVRDTVSVPVGAKSTVSYYVYARLLEGLVRTRIRNRMPDFVTLVGQLDENPGVDLATLKPLVRHIPTFGWQGSLAKLTYSALATFSSCLGTDRPFLSASGGIRDCEGVVNSMALGATTVQLQTAILDRGAAVVTEILDDLERYLGEHAIPRAAEIIGVASRDYIPSLALGEFMLARDRLHGKLCAAVDRDLCTGCGLCAELCTEGAIRIEDDRPVVDRERCRGCNLCVLKCPQEAMELDPFDSLERLMAEYKESPAARSFKAFMQKERIGFTDLLGLPRKLKSWGFL
ncbi:MAG: 4Fe-4S binding protein [bacterium]